MAPDTDNSLYQDKEAPVLDLYPSAKAAVPRFVGWILIAIALTLVVRLAGTSVVQFNEILPRGGSEWLVLAVWVICLWQPVLLLLTLKTSRYQISTQRLEYTRGILSRQRDQIELARIRDITTQRTLMDRLLGIGNVILDTSDRSDPIFTIRAQPNAYALADHLHELNTSERKRLGYREFTATDHV